MRRLPRWRVPPMAVLLAACLGAGLASVPAAHGQGEVPEPPLVGPGGAENGRITLSPTAQVAGRDHATWVLANGGPQALRFTLALHEVVSDGRDLDLGGQRTDLPLDANDLRLASGEAARVNVPVPADAAPGVVALVATTVDAPPDTEVSALAVVGRVGEVEPSIVDTDATTGRVTLHLDAARPALVDVALRVRAWPGVSTGQREAEALVVPTGGRDVDVSVGGPAVGRVTVEVAVSGSPARAVRTVWWWPRDLVATVALGLLLVTTVLLVLRVRFTRRR